MEINDPNPHGANGTITQLSGVSNLAWSVPDAMSVSDNYHLYYRGEQLLIIIIYYRGKQLLIIIIYITGGLSSECWELEGEPASLARALEEEVMGLYTLWEKSFHSTSSQVSKHSRQWFSSLSRFSYDI